MEHSLPAVPDGPLGVPYPAPPVRTGPGYPLLASLIPFRSVPVPYSARRSSG